MNKLKILHILHAVGGVDVSLRIITENLNSDAFENIIIHGKDDTQKPFLDDQARHLKSYSLNIFRNIHPIKDFQSIIQTIRIIKKEKPQIIHAHSAKGGVIGKVAGRFTKTPVLHTPQAYSYLSSENKIKRKIYLFFEKILAQFNNKILASSNSEKNRAIHEVGYQKKRVLVFNNAINSIENFQDLSFQKTWPDKYICSVGRPSYQKNIEWMIEIMHSLREEFPEIHLVLMGVGFHSPNLKNVKSLIEKYNLQDNISLLEWTSREDVFHIIKNSQVYISTARYEGLPYSVIESLALGKACVVSDADGNRDLIKHGENGFVIDQNDTLSFKNMIVKLISNTKLRKEFEEKSKKFFNQKFNINYTISNLEEIYKANKKY